MINAIKNTYMLVKQALGRASSHCPSFDSHHYVDTCASVLYDSSNWQMQPDPELQSLQNEIKPQR